MTIKETLNLFKDAENSFTLFEPVKGKKPVIVLRSKYGARKFYINENADLQQTKEKAIKIDEQLCCNPVPKHLRKFAGFDIIDLDES